MADAPNWISQYMESFRSGEAHSFLLHGDVDGTAYEAVSQRGLLLAALAQKREVVAVYHRAGGIELYNAEEQITVNTRQITRRQRALDLTGIGSAAAGQAATAPMAAALAQLGQAAPSSDPFTGARRPSDAVDLLDKLLRADAGRGKVAVILDYADTLCPPADKAAMSPDDRTLLVTLLTWAKDPRIARANNPIFLLSRMLTDLHPDLRTSGSGYKVLEMALPDRDARGAYLDWYLARRQEQQKTIALRDGLAVAEIANMTAGLSLRNIEDVLLLAAQTGLTRALLKGRKDEIIRAEQAEVAEMIEPLPNGFTDLYGADYIKTWAEDDIIAPVRAGRLADVPKGILLVGPPGTGKTYFARALAKSIGFNAVALKSENILDGIVGASERKLRQFFAFCRSLAPVLVFFDEIDQSDMSRRGNGSGNPVAANLFNQMLQFMSDETMRGKVIMVFASNRPDLLDDAFKRSGRIDAIIPILLPDADQRRAMLTGIATSLGTPLAANVAEDVAAQTDKYNAADLREVVNKARKRAVRAGTTQIALDDARQALRFYRPNGVGKADWYTLLAIDACNDAEHLPPQYAALLNDRDALRADIRTTAPENPSNERLARDW